MTVITECDIPAGSLLDRQAIQSAYFRDSYSIPLRDEDMDVATIFFAVFGHHPGWAKGALIIRNRIAGWFGLDVPADTTILRPVQKAHYQVGESIGPWPIYALSRRELVAGRDNRHLDFRLSLLKTGTADAPRVVVSTICNVHNLFGKIYLFFIVPFHKWGVKRLLAAAVQSRRV
jgi:Protein of unknown function (DUF2867)